MHAVNLIKLVTCILVYSLIFASCRVHKNMKETSPEPENSVTNQPVHNIYSAGAKMFIHDFRAGTASNKGIPDSVLIDKYSLEKINNIYFVGVLARVTEHFNAADLIPLNAITGSNFRGSLSIKIPAGNVEKLVSVPGIEYIDVGRKIILKK